MSTNTLADRAVAIRQANDILRSTLLTGNIFKSAAFDRLTDGEQASLLGKLQRTRDFPRALDPEGLHAGGIVSSGPLRLQWSIRAYNATFQGPSPDPADPFQTRRALVLELL